MTQLSLYCPLRSPLGYWRTRVYRTRNVDNGGDKRPRPPLVFITDSNRNDDFRRKIRFAELSLNIVGPKLFKLTKDKKNRSDETVDNNYHPARASSDVASSPAPSPGSRPAPEGAWSARRGVLRLQSARCSIRPVVPGKVLRPRLKRQCPSPTAPAARSHPGGRVRAAAVVEMIEYRCASVAVPPMA